jgi:regulator of sigma E protease
MIAGFGIDLIYAILAFGLVLIPAIIIHEFGHFFAAKAVGVSVLEFGIGFPPKMIKLFRWGETEFTLNWLPIGGFVRPYGEDFVGPTPEPKEGEEPNEKRKNDTVYVSDRDELIARGVPADKIKSVSQATPLQRIFFFVMGAGFNFISAIIVFMIIALIGLPMIIGAGFHVDILNTENNLFTGTRVQTGDIIEQFNGEHLRDDADFIDRWLSSVDQEVTLTIRNLEKTSDSYIVTVIPQSTNVSPRSKILTTTNGSPAQLAGIQPGDLIVGLNGNRFVYGQDPSAIVRNAGVEYAGQNLTLMVERNGVLLDITLVPRLDPKPNQGHIGIGVKTQYVVGNGIAFQPAGPVLELVPQSLPTAIQYGFTRIWDTMSLIVSIPGQLIQGKIDPEQARPVSIVGISQFGGRLLQQSVEQGTPTIILNFFALVSIFLGFTNLLPIPALDGGRVVFALVEIARGKPVPPEIEGRIHMVGLIILLLLGVMVIFLDIFRPVTLP